MLCGGCVVSNRMCCSASSKFGLSFSTISRCRHPSNTVPPSQIPQPALWAGNVQPLQVRVRLRPRHVELIQRLPGLVLLSLPRPALPFYPPRILRTSVSSRSAVKNPVKADRGKKKSRGTCRGVIGLRLPGQQIRHSYLLSPLPGASLAFSTR